MDNLSSRTKSRLRLPIFPTPLKAGAGFKHEHLQHILQDKNGVGFFEVHAENLMGDGGAPHAALAALREGYPVFLHGVGMSLGGEAPLNLEHLKRFLQVAERYEPMIISEHLAWSSHDTTYYNDLLPRALHQASAGPCGLPYPPIPERIGAQNVAGKPVNLCGIRTLRHERNSIFA
jgi:uncharacterized protein